VPRRLEVWAPHAEHVDLALADRRVPMVPATDGWFEADTVTGHGDRYGFSLDGGPVRPDPRAVWLPDGVHSPGRLYEHDRFGWTDTSWAGRAWDDAVLYELHVGTFTPDGTFGAAARRLGHLVELGITHVELLPVAAFDGPAGWGYDQVAPWSVHEPYGGPDGLKQFVDAAHAHGLAVLLDVVHNHVGASGNYLPEFGPYLTDRVRTPWGEAVNLDGPGSDQVRAFLLGSVESWLRDFHADGIRLDAVHEMHDERALTFLEELSARVETLSEQLGRPLVAVAESDRNDPRTVTPRRHRGLGMSAQWDDDVHHALHTWLTGESQGYYADFAANPARALQTVYTEAFFHAGTYSSFRGRTHGRPVDTSRVPGSAFVASLQTHDQVGNRAVGDRLVALLPPGHLAAGAALLLLGPFVPMLFMGEEWAASTPWQFFSSFPDPALATAVTQGRRAEFAEHGWPDTVPDPQDPATLRRSRLDWTEVDRVEHRRMLDWYRTLIGLRHEHPELREPRLDHVRLDADSEHALMSRGTFRILVNLASDPWAAELDATARRIAAFGVPGDALADDARRIRLPSQSVAVLRVEA
jgi:maltooligosyltrehalose trehalohydrolase